MSPLERRASNLNRHCEEPNSFLGDEAIHDAVHSLDCRASLAMTIQI